MTYKNIYFQASTDSSYTVTGLEPGRPVDFIFRVLTTSGPTTLFATSQTLGELV